MHDQLDRVFRAGSRLGPPRDRPGSDHARHGRRSGHGGTGKPGLQRRHHHHQRRRMPGAGRRRPVRGRARPADRRCAGEALSAGGPAGASEPFTQRARPTRSASLSSGRTATRHPGGAADCRARAPALHAVSAQTAVPLRCAGRLRGSGTLAPSGPRRHQPGSIPAAGGSFIVDGSPGKSSPWR